MMMHVRRLEARDKPEWLELLFKGYIAFYKATVAEEVIEATWQRLWRREISTQPSSRSTAATRRSRLARVLFHPSTWSVQGYCLQDLFVDPARRGGRG